MRPTPLFALFALFAPPAATRAQYPFPIELESHRKPVSRIDGSCLIQGGTVLTATKGTLENTDILVMNGRIARLGKNLEASESIPRIKAHGKIVAPGFVDGHSHRASSGTNEGSDSITSEVRIGDVLNPSALNVWQALASGHTSAMVLHGSANAIGGQSVVIKYKYGAKSAELPIGDAPRMIKFALGENVTRKSSSTASRFPNTRMGQEAVYRRAFTEAKQYQAGWEAFRSGKTKVPPRRDLRLETLADILAGKIWVQCHSYRSDEMLMMVRLSQEYGFKIGALQHALEAYKIAPELAKAQVGVSIFVDSWSFKLEGYDATPWNAWICKKAGVNVSINTDGVSGTTALNIDAAKTMRFGGLTEEEALQTITINPARQLGIDHRVGSIEVGKDADISIWEGHPLSVYSKCAMTLIEGKVYFERRDAFEVDPRSKVKRKLDRKMNRSEGTDLPRKSDRYAIRGATIHTVDRGPIVNGTVVFENGIITAVGQNARIPRGTVVIDGRGKHVYPGFIDAYNSIGLAEISPIPVMMDNRELGSFNADLDSMTNIWVESTHFGPARFNGVLNALSAPSGGAISGRGALIHTDGYTTEEFGVRRHAALVVNLQPGRGREDFDLCDQIDESALFGGEAHRGDSHLTEHEREAFVEFLGGRVPEAPSPQNPPADPAIEGHFEKAIAYKKEREQSPETPVNLKYEAMLPYIEGRATVAVSANSASAIRSAVAFIQKYRLKGVIVGAADAYKETALLRSSGVPVIIAPGGRSTLSANQNASAWEPYDLPYVRPALLAQAGVKFAFTGGEGSDCMMLPVRVGQSCAYGLSVDDAVRALTLSAAEIYGVETQLGSITAGKIANLFVTDGDPFEMTSTMRYVFINGKPRPLTSKHTALRDKYLNR